MEESVRKSMWRLGGLSLYQLGRRTVAGYMRNQLGSKSAQFAYYSMLSIAPLLILAIAAISRMPLTGVLGGFLRVLRHGLPGDAYTVVHDQILSLQGHTTGRLVGVSVFVFIYAAWQLFLSISDGLHAAFAVDPMLRRWRAHWVSLTFSVSIVVLLLISLVLLTLGTEAIQWAAGLVNLSSVSWVVIHAARAAIVGTALLLLTDAIYALIPAADNGWHWLSPGSVFAVAGWTTASQAFRLYVWYFRPYNETYGALAGVVALLLWLYLIGSILMVGGQINGVIFQAANEGRTNPQVPLHT